MAVLLGVISAFFFSITFVLNQVMSLDGGDWLWTAALRYLIMLPFFFFIVARKRHQLRKVFNEIKRSPLRWILWSQVGFGLFYVPLTFASTLAPGWLVASTWQITIIAGSILAPFLAKTNQAKIDSRMTTFDLFCFAVILFGIVLVESSHFSASSWQNSLLAFFVVLVAAFAYPLGNRKVMLLNVEGSNLTTMERILAMLICSLPTWLICSVIAFVRSGLPSQSQVTASFIVALSSGVIATYLFFQGTQMVHHNLRLLATTEATQSLEVVFSVLLGILILGDPLPSIVTFFGLACIVAGMSIKVMR